jgi:hypothetical protein
MAAQTAGADCPPTLRAATFQLAVPQQGRDRVGAFHTALVTRILERSGLRWSHQRLPYARALVELEAGRIDTLITADAAIRTLQPPVGQLPLMRLRVVWLHLDEDPPASEPIGTLRGYPVPRPLRLRGFPEVKVSHYESLLGMVDKDRLRQIVAVRPSVDAYLQDFPGLAARLRRDEVEQQQMLLAVSAALDGACQQRLAALVEALRREGLAELFRAHFPEQDFADFSLGPPR